MEDTTDSVGTQLMRWREIEWELEPMSIHAQPPVSNRHSRFRYIMNASTSMSQALTVDKLFFSYTLNQVQRI